jgi:sulfite dehydrogenase
VKRALGTPIVVAAVTLAGAAVGFTRGGAADVPVPRAEPVATPAAAPEPAPRPAGPRALFASTCGACHALHDAGVHGMVGPDLDAVRPSAGRVRRAIRTGSIDGVMQPGLLRGRDARAVAAYVARASRR